MQLGGQRSAHVGRYRIQAMATMTGVSAPTLRAWERRYQIPQPQRTASAYRLYTDADVEQVRRMRDLCAAGHCAAQAASLVRQQVPLAGDAVVQDPLQIMRNTLLEATLQYDEAGLQDCLRQVLTAGPASLLYEEVIAPVMVRVGELWSCGELSIAQEHLLTQHVETCLRNLLQLVQPVDATRVVLLGCLAGEHHTLGLYGVGLRFAGWGYRVVHLGARLPPEALQQAVAHVHPQLVGLSSSSMGMGRNDAAPAQNIELCQAYAHACGETPWLVGGGTAEQVAEPVRQNGGLVAAGSFDEVRNQLETLRRPRL